MNRFTSTLTRHWKNTPTEKYHNFVITYYLASLLHSNKYTPTILVTLYLRQWFIGILHHFNDLFIKISTPIDFWAYIVYIKYNKAPMYCLTRSSYQVYTDARQVGNSLYHCSYSWSWWGPGSVWWCAWGRVSPLTSLLRREAIKCLL